VFQDREHKKKYNIEVTTGTLLRNIALILLTLALSGYIFLQYRGIPIPVLIFAVAVLWGVFVSKKTRFGRRLYAIGGNETVAWLSGIDVFKSKVQVYTIVAILSSISGIILASRLNGASPNLGTGFELDAIASVIIGGTSFMGGIGTVSGTVTGTLIIGVINNGMSMMGISTFFQMIVKGVIIILAVLLDVINRRRRIK
jgi:D-xylose transport system permease protein